MGPTASGKSSLAIKLAKKFKGEIISADSRQVYRGMDIGTGKISKKEQRLVPHYLMDVANPKKQFTVSDFKKLGAQAIERIKKKHKLPFIVGGTAFYIYSLIDDWQIPEVAPNKKLRNTLRNKSTRELFAMLQKLDPRRAANIDSRNPARLSRAIEIVKTTGRPVPSLSSPTPIGDLNKDSRFRGNDTKVLLLGIRKDQNELYKLIDKRLEERLRSGMVAEVKKLHKSGLSWNKLESFGLEYRFVSLYLQNKLSYRKMVDQLKSAIHKFSKRQNTWFKRDTRIHWIKNEKEARKLIKPYLSS